MTGTRFTLSLEQAWLGFEQKDELDHGVMISIKGKQNQGVMVSTLRKLSNIVGLPRQLGVELLIALLV